MVILASNLIICFRFECKNTSLTTNVIGLTGTTLVFLKRRLTHGLKMMKESEEEGGGGELKQLS